MSPPKGFDCMRCNCQWLPEIYSSCVLVVTGEANNKVMILVLRIKNCIMVDLANTIYIIVSYEKTQDVDLRNIAMYYFKHIKHEVLRLA